MVIFMKVNRKEINYENLSYILINISEMIDSGINILTAMNILEDGIEGTRNKLIINRMKENIKSGHSISEAFKREDSMPKLCNELVAIAEETGSLNKVLIQLSNYYKKLYSFKKQIISSLAYPIILFLLLIIMVVFLFIMLVPSFSEMYASMEIVPSWLLGKLFNLREFAEKNTLIFYLYSAIYGIVIPYVVVVYFFKELAIRNIFKLKIVFQYKEYIMLMMLNMIFESGINLQRAFSKFSKEIKNPLIKSHIKEINEGLLKGKSLRFTLKQEKIFSEYTLAVISIGEEIGKLSENINRAMIKSEENLLQKTKKISGAIQPTFILIISFLIVGIVLTFLMPLYQGIKIWGKKVLH